MALVAMINGVEVHSDMAVAVINNSRITFTDGSWCDVATRQIVSNGRGSISIGTSASADSLAEPITKGPDRYVARMLNLRDLDAEVTVEPYDSSEILVTITGPKDRVDAITAEVQDAGLTLRDNGRSGGGKYNLGGVSVSGGSIVVGDGVFMSNSFGRGGSVSVISGGSLRQKNPVQVDIKVPRRLSITVVSSGTGNTRIGDVGGDLVARTSGSGDITAGRMATVNLMTSGTGDIEIAEINGNVGIVTSGTGDVSIDGGEIPMLVATTSGTGDIKVDATATDALLTSSGTGDIKLRRSINRPRQTKSGFGSIKVRTIG